MNKFGTTPILEARHVSMQFGKFKALSDVSTSFAAGSLTAIIGPNGAGKSTFFNVLSGAFPPSEGQILFNGVDITHQKPYEFARIGISKSFQITNVFKQLSVHENVRVAAQMQVSRFNFLKDAHSLSGTIKSADELLERVGLHHLRHKKSGDLAHGLSLIHI